MVTAAAAAAAAATAAAGAAAEEEDEPQVESCTPSPQFLIIHDGPFCRRHATPPYAPCCSGGVPGTRGVSRIPSQEHQHQQQEEEEEEEQEEGC